MYRFAGGGYGGSQRGDGLTNGCSTIGIARTTPIEVAELHNPLLFNEYAIVEGSGGAGRHRGGFGARYSATIRSGTARASFLMDHGRFGPPGVLGGQSGGMTAITVVRHGEVYVPPHISKDQDIAVSEGDTITVTSPGGGGYGDPLERDPKAVVQDVRRQYYSVAEAARLFAVVVDPETHLVDISQTAKLRTSRRKVKRTPDGESPSDRPD
jgi:N-methylhydantoinase B